jgi:hypothetical protein
MAYGQTRDGSMKEMTEEQWQRRQEAIANLPPRVKPEPISEEDDDELLEREYGRLGDKSPPRLTLETIQARPTGTAPERQPRQLHKEKASNEELSTGPSNSQPQGLALTEHCPYITINDFLTNCRGCGIDWVEKALLAIINFNTGSYGYATISCEQLGHWLERSPGTVENMIGKLDNLGFLKNLGKYRGKHRLAVRPKWRNPTCKKRQDDIPF